MILDLHAVFNLLGRLNGELVKQVIELILFTLITYMISSEYTRDRRKELKYLIVGFGTLSLQKLISSVVLGSIVFGDLFPSAYTYFYSVLNNALETFAIALLASAFLFPIQRRSLKWDFAFEFFSIGGIYLILESIHIYEFFTKSRGPVILWSNIIFNLLRMIIILTTIYLLTKRTDRRYKYRYSTIFAFMVYLIDPLLHFVAYAFFGGNAPKLFVAAHPFPLLAVVLFTRVMYLKLADKAYLKEQLAHEKEISSLKDKFVSVVSHELRTPLTSINLYTSLLRDGKLGKVNTKQKEAASIIKGESHRLNELVGDILDLSRLEKKTEVKIGKFDLNGFMKTGVHNNLAKEKKIKIVTKIPKDFVINVDEGKFTQVMINLLSNAIKYSDKGVITVTGIKGEKIEIIVEDQGQGIPPEELPKIFDKFYQVEHHMTRKQGGTGLGLAIVNEIVKAHKGKIEVESEFGKGSKFRIILPNNL